MAQNSAWGFEVLPPTGVGLTPEKMWCESGICKGYTTYRQLHILVNPRKRRLAAAVPVSIEGIVWVIATACVSMVSLTFASICSLEY